jgi:type I restriction enzyme S subunit
MSLPKYSHYKDSGVEWLGAVPAHWMTGKIQAFARRESGHTPSRQHPEYWQNCTIPWFSLADVSQIRAGNVKYVYQTKELVSELGLANSSARLLPAGTVMLSRTASVGYSAIMGRDMATTQDFINWVCKPELNPEFLLYVLRAMRKEFDRLMMGSTHQTIYMPDVAKLMMPLPPVDEQKEIIAFLDRETGKIDALIAEQEKLIALLAEKRQATICNAVTHGLNPNAPMKDPGVAWLEEVPAHWLVSRVKYLVTGDGIQMGPFGGMLLDLSANDTGFKVYGQENTISGDFSRGSRWVSESRFRDLEKYCLRDGDLVLTRKGSLGNARLIFNLPQPGICDSDTIRVRANETLILPNFLALLLHDAGYVETQITISKRGAILSGLNTETVANLVLAVPPIREQRALLEALESRLAKFDNCIQEATRVVARLKERRSALITAAVTGQIDVHCTLVEQPTSREALVE